MERHARITVAGVAARYRGAQRAAKACRGRGAPTGTKWYGPRGRG